MNEGRGGMVIGAWSRWSKVVLESHRRKSGPYATHISLFRNRCGCIKVTQELQLYVGGVTYRYWRTRSRGFEGISEIGTWNIFVRIYSFFIVLQLQAPRNLYRAGLTRPTILSRKFPEIPQCNTVRMSKSIRSLNCAFKLDTGNLYIQIIFAIIEFLLRFLAPCTRRIFYQKKFDDFLI